MGATGDMRFWFDVQTPKQARLFHHLAKTVEDVYGAETIITTREYNYSHEVLESYGREYYSFGKHGGASLYKKLEHSIDRMQKLSKLINSWKEEDPDNPIYNVSFASPDSSRVAYGLKIPIIVVHDTPNSKTLQLAGNFVSQIILSCAFKGTEAMIKYLPDARSELFDGVDEVEWVQSYKVKPQAFPEVGIEKGDSYILIRPEEVFAAYYLEIGFDTKSNFLEKVVKKIQKQYDGRIVLLPRYLQQYEELNRAFKSYKNIGISKFGLDTMKAIPFADGLITGGGTMTREAALQGVPALCYSPYTGPNDQYVRSRGFPLIHEKTLNDAFLSIDTLLGEWDIEKGVLAERLQKMEKPSAGLLRVMKKDYNSEPK